MGFNPAIVDQTTYRMFSQLVSSVGDGTGTTNMNVNGSVTPQIFTVDAVADCDIHIMSIVVFIGDSAAAHGKFGNVNALANGWDLMISQGGIDTNIVNKAKTGGEVIQQSASSLAWGDTMTSFELSDYSGNQDATLVVIPLRNFIPGGGRIASGSEDALSSIVNDDLLELDDFVVRAIGYKHYNL
jgi:hypothetical protein